MVRQRESTTAKLLIKDQVKVKESV